MLNNLFMRLSVGIVILKQLFLGLSTYCIALAGKYIVANHINQTILALVLFFVFALLAYLVHSVNQLLLLKAKEQMFSHYLSTTFNRIQDEQAFNHHQAKQETVAWFAGEVKNTLAKTVDFISQSLDLYLNIIITFVVFYYTIGAKMSLIILGAFVLSLGLVFASKNHIKKLAIEQQDSHWQLNQYFATHWDYAIFGNNQLFDKSSKDITKKVHRYYHSEARYLIVEQIIAMLPILLCVVCLVLYLISSNSQTEQLAMMVAILPRTLQLLSSVHSLSANNAQITVIKTQYQKVAHYQPKMVDVMHHIRQDKIIIQDVLSSKHYNCDMLMAFIKTAKNNKQTGRFLISGNNGVGKSSLLKYIKSQTDGAILLSPDSHFDYAKDGLSTGQAQFNKLMDFLTMIEHQQITCKLLLLDEWDANFDKAHTQMIDEIVTKLSQDYLIIEIRHRIQNSNDGH